MNSNSRTGRRGTNNNCTLIAMDNLGLKTDKTYYEHGKGMCGHYVIRTVNKQKRIRLFYREKSKRITTLQFARKYSKGLFLVFVSGAHAGVIDNGKLLNLNKRPRILYAYKVPR